MTDGSWTVVIYISFLDEADKYELVWREYGNPYFQEITKFFVVGNFAKGKSKTVETVDTSLATDEQVRLSFQESYEANFGAGSWRE